MKPIASSFKNKHMAYCLKLSFGIISSSRFVDIKTMNIIFSHVEINKVLVNNPNNSIYYCLNSYHKESVKIQRNNITLL